VMEINASNAKQQAGGKNQLWFNAPKKQKYLSK
jgi:hypothetical protein